MVLNIATKEDLQELKRELIEEIKSILTEMHNPARKWLKSHEVRKLLTISPGKLQQLRDKGTLPFTKIGGVLYYDYEDIQKMLRANKHDPFFLKKKRTATSFDDPVDLPKTAIEAKVRPRRRSTRRTEPADDHYTLNL